MQDQAQFVDCGGSDRFPMGHSAERIAADAIVVNQGVFCNASFFHCIPTITVADHMDTSDNSIVCYKQNIKHM